jgi:hypothetical protein
MYIFLSFLLFWYMDMCCLAFDKSMWEPFVRCNIFLYTRL